MHVAPLNFAEPIPLFPLPNCVLFPGVVQPLHIFEPRYKQMMAHALARQSAIAIALLKPGWEKNYHSIPAIHELVGVGRIVTHEKLADGKFNLLLHGVTRVQVRSEQTVGEPAQGVFRTAMLDPVPDSPHLTCQQSSAQLLQRKVLHELFENTSLKHLTIAASLQCLFDSPVPMPRLIDVLSFTLIQDIPTKQRLLEELDPVKRGEFLLRELITLTHHLDTQPPSHSPPLEPAAVQSWPPPLSAQLSPRYAPHLALAS